MNGRSVPQKRARPPSRGSTPSQWKSPRVIEISSGSESDVASRRQTKRQKSATPLTNGASSSSSYTRLNAKPGSSVSQTATGQASSLRESQPDRRDSRLNKQNDHTQSGSLLQKARPWRLNTEQLARVTDASGILKSNVSQPQLNSSQHSSQAIPSSGSRFPASSFPNGQPLTSDKPAGDRMTGSSYSMTNSKSSSDTSRVKSVKDEASGVDLLDEESDTNPLQLFQKPSAPTNSNKTNDIKRTERPSVSVPIRQSQSPTKTTQRTTPSSAVFHSFKLEVPLSQSEDLASPAYKAKKKALFQELEKSTDVAKQRLPEVEKYFGQTGFSKAFETTKDAERKERAAPKYKRDIDVKKFFEETDFDEMWAEIQIESGVPPEEVTKFTLEIKDPKADKFPQPYDYDGDELLQKILDESFAQHPDPPLTFKNEVDNRRINSMFQFMGEYVIRDGVKLAPPSKNRGCRCQGQCIPATCTCLHKQVPVEPFNPLNKATNTKSIKTYYQSPKDPSTIVLEPEYIANELRAENTHYEITECNNICGCGPDCWNRVVGRGRTLSLEIYMTERCGFGVRYPHGPILKGQFIDVYLGEVITQRELEAREEAKPDEAPSYIYSLDWFGAPNPNHVDGEYFGSPMRFVNHSCSPNARSFPVMTHHGDKNVYHLAFFAIRDIPAGEQITIDYQPQDAIPEEDEEDRVKVARSRSGSSGEINVVMSGGSSAEPEDEVRSSAGSMSSRSRKSGGKGEGNAKEVEQPAPRVRSYQDVIDDTIEEGDGRSRCYCGAPNCRIWLWRAGGRQRRKRRHL